MHENDPELINAGTRPELGYEHRDVDLPGIGKATFWFFLVSTVMIFITVPIWCGTAGILGGLKQGREANLTIPSAPNPLLQSGASAKTDIATLRRAEEKQMTTYGWIDRAKGVARIPVRRAMEIVVAKGLSPEANR